MNCKFNNYFCSRSYYAYTITVIALVWSLLAISPPTWAQGQGTDKHTVNRINIQLIDKTLPEIFSYLTEKTGFYFAYDADELPNRRYSFNLQNISLNAFFNKLSAKADLSFSKYKKTYSVTSKSQRLKQSKPENLRKIQGKVYDAQTNEALIGANVVVKGENIGTATDINGAFTLSVPDEAKVLLVSFVGYQVTEVPMGKRSNFEIALQSDAAALGDVVVIGYGASSKKKLLGSVSKIDHNKFADLPIPTFDQALVGNTSGVQLIQSTGEPGGDAIIRIRGTSSISSYTAPLIVVDGYPLSDNSEYVSIPPSEIKSIEILKDAASAAIYGSRGANGVILISTKQGEYGKPKYQYSSYYGIQRVENTIELMDAYEYAAFKTEVLNNIWVGYDPANNSSDDPNNLRDDPTKIPEILQHYNLGEAGLVNTDWQDEIFRDAFLSKHQLAVSGGNNLIKYRVSAGYLDQEGIVINSAYQRYDFKTVLDLKLSDRVSIGVNLSPIFSKTNRISQKNHKGDGIVASAVIASPIYPVYNTFGDLAISQMINNTLKVGGSGQVENPVAMALHTKDVRKDARLLGQFNLKINLLEGLDFKAKFGTDYKTRTEEYFRPSFIGSYQDPTPVEAVGRHETLKLVNLLFENTLTYDKTLGNEHNLNVLAGFTYQNERIEWSDIRGLDFPNNNVQTLNAAQTIQNGLTRIEEWVLLSYFSRLKYDYKNKYLLSLSIRGDASSRFGKNSKWGYFPSASLGWRVSEEAFLSLSKWLSELKLRGSYGLTGNFNIPNYGAIPLLSQDNYILDNSLQIGLLPATAPNESLSWEQSKMLDLGLDLGLWDDRITLIIDYYKTATDGLLLEVPVPTISGYDESLQNLGKTQNTGWDFELQTNFTLGKLQWTAGATLSFFKNKVLELGPGQDQIITPRHITRIGEQIGQFYGYRILGVFTSEEQLQSLPTFSTAKLGTYIYEDANGDGVMNTDDFTVIGDPFPDYVLGFNSRLSYQGFDLSFVIESKQGIDIWERLRGFYMDQTGFSNKPRAFINNHYKIDGSIENPQYARYEVGSGRDTEFFDSSLMVQDASFVRIRNITLGYNFRQSLVNKIGLDALRIYLSAQNPFIFTNYAGYNPESSNARSPLNAGVDYGNYPTSKSFVFGLNLNF